jgi:glucokinase
VNATRVHYNPLVLLAADIGGTKTLLGLFEPAPRRPRPVVAHTYRTDLFSSIVEMLQTFTKDVGTPFVIDAAVAGVAGPVVDGAARLTHVGWNVSAAELAPQLHARRVRLLNDLEAMALGASVLGPQELVQLQRGVARDDGNIAVIAAGTGLGQAYLHRVDGRLRPVPSEGGHADFAARTDREIDLVRMLRRVHGRAEVEQIISGPGLLNLHRFTHDGRDCPASRGLDETNAPASVSRTAMDGSCQACVEALSLFVEAYGAEAGNLALRGVATSGIFLGGGIAPQILPALRDGRFINAFCAKGAMSSLAANIPVHVMLMPKAGLLGAAVWAQELSG